MALFEVRRTIRFASMICCFPFFMIIPRDSTQTHKQASSMNSNHNEQQSIMTITEQERRRPSLMEMETESEETSISTASTTELSEEDSFASVSSAASSTSSSHKSKKSRKGKKRRKKAKKGSKKKGRKESDKNGVAFGTTEILEFNRSIAYHSVSDKGVPIGLGSTLIRSETVSVSKFEKRRKDRDAELSPEKRRRLLKAEGFSNEAILEANQASMLVRISRKQSVLNMKWDDWHAKKERVGRRVRKWTNPKILYKRGTHYLSRRPSSEATSIPVQ